MTSTRQVASLVTGNTLIVFLDGTQYTIGVDHKNFEKIKDALAQKNYDAIPALADVRNTVRSWLTGDQSFVLNGDHIELDGDSFSGAVTDKVLRLIDDGQSPDSLFAFLRKVRQNPSKTAQDELLLFCVANNFMIHEDGDIIAYKSVRGDYKDIHSGTFTNTVGSVQEMPRWKVDDNRERTCSQGLHFASYSYASTWAGKINGVDRRLMLIKLNPADVVSIPNDYENAKGRTWRYEVVAEITENGGPLPEKEVYTDRDWLGEDEGVYDADAWEREVLKADLENYTERLNYLHDRRSELVHEEKLAIDYTERRALLQEIMDLDSEIDDVTNEVEMIEEQLDNLNNNS